MPGTIDFEALIDAVLNQGKSLSSQERIEMIEHTDWCAEGEHKQEDLAQLSDRDLAQTCYYAMCDWVNCNCD